MRGRHKKAGVENSIESLLNEEAMPDDAVLPPEEQAVTGEPAPGTTGITASAGAAQQLDDQIALLNEALEEHKRLAAEHLNQALRAQAELDNVRKRTARDIENAHKYALERFVAELLPVMDSMEMGIAASTNAEDVASLKQGMELTLKMFSVVLDKCGVQVIDPLGEKFNPERHEAVSMLREEGVEPGKVVRVMQKGYELNGRLVRPAMVMVSQ